MNLRTTSRATLVALLAAAALATTAPAVALPTPADSTSTATAAADCKDVLFLSMRGSGQAIDNTPEMDAVRSGLRDTLGVYGNPITVEFLAVDYQAEPIETLLLPGGPGVFNASINNGTTMLDLTVDIHQALCPDQAIILAGFSQGAMAIQQYLASPLLEQSNLDRIVAVGLVASGDREKGKGWVAQEVGTSKSGWGIRPVMLQSDPANVRSELNKRLLSLCERGDTVCDNVNAGLLPGLDLHGNAYQGTRGAALGSKLAGMALDAAYPQATAVTALPGTYVSFPLQTRTGVNGTKWRLAAGSAALPAGMKPHWGKGVIQGTPTMAGTYTFTVEANAKNGAWLPATITLTVAAPQPDGPELTVHFTGTVTDMYDVVRVPNEDGDYDYVAGSLAPAGVKVGSTVSGTYTYRTDTPDTHWDVTDTQRGVYRYAEAPNGATLQLGAVSIGTTYPPDPWADPFGISVSPSSFQWTSVFPTSSDGTPIIEFSWNSFGDEGALPSDALPTGPIDLSAFTQNSIGVVACADDFYNGDVGCRTAGYGIQIQVTSTSR